MDHEAFRVESRERWEAATPGWIARADAFAAATEPVTRWLVDAVDPQPGETVLELAGGLGDTGLLAAERVGAQGKVIITDGAEAMVAAARERADAAGATNVETKAMEAEWIDLSAATVDAVVSRWGYMLLADPEAALRETRRVLRPGGRLALAAWSAREHNPWLALVSDVLVAQDLVQVPAPDVPGPFSFAPDGTVEGLLAATGFTDIAVSTVDFPIGAPTLDDWWEHHRNQSVALATATADLSPKAHYELRDAFDAAFTSFVQADGSVVVPARALMASAEA